MLEVMDGLRGGGDGWKEGGIDGWEEQKSGEDGWRWETAVIGWWLDIGG